MVEDKQAQTKDWHHDCKDKKAFVNAKTDNAMMSPSRSICVGTINGNVLDIQTESSDPVGGADVEEALKK